MAFELLDILLKAQQADGSDLKHAEESLKQSEEKNLSEFLISLSEELANRKNPVNKRMLAGLVLKNSLHAKLSDRSYELKQGWLFLDVGVKEKIKANLFKTLTSSADKARSTASQVIATVARIELSQEQWPNLYASLFPSSHYVPPFETLGYLCEEVLKYSINENVVNKILTHIVQGMNAHEASNGVRLATTRALYKALVLAEFGYIEPGFDEEDDFTDDDIIKAVCEETKVSSDDIIKAVCEATKVSSDVKIQQAAFECLDFILPSYYEKLGTFVEEILETTDIAGNEYEEPVAVQAIEIWSSICNEEMGYLDNYIFTRIPCLHLTKNALPRLVPMLLETIVKQEEEEEDQDGAWNVAMAGRRCLGLVARIVGDDIDPLVMPFIGENITKPEWRKREAATYAFGSILEGLSTNQLVQHVKVHLSRMLTALAEDPNNHVKDTTSWTLGRISKCLLVIAKVSGIELPPPQEQLPELIDSLLLSSHQFPSHHVSLKTLGYLCKEVSSDAPKQDEVNKILTAIVKCMDASEASNVRLAATRALYNALAFCRRIFTDDIMKAVCEATSDVKIQQAAFECLVSISSGYNGMLAPYMKKILEITCRAVKEYEEPVALLAIEIWILIWDFEMGYLKVHGHNTTSYLDSMKIALPEFVPMLLETIVKQEDQDGAWNVAMAGRRCFVSVVEVVGDDIIPLAMPFIRDNITKSDWRQKEAAAYAFSSILDVPSSYQLVEHDAVPLSLMLTALAEDPNNHVKDTIAWTLERIFQRFHDLIGIVYSAYSKQIIRVLLGSMKKDAPNVAEKACRALYYLAQGFRGMHQWSSNPMTSYFEIIVQSLLEVTHREDADLTSAACKTLNEVVWCSTEEKAFQLLPTIKRELHKTLKEQKKQNEMWKLLDVIIHKLKNSLMQHANDIMNLLLIVLACPSATAHEEAMLAVSTLACAMGPLFEKQMPDFYYKYLEKRLRNLKNDQECVVTLRVVGFIFRALKENGLTWYLRVMPKLVEHYKSERVDPDVKPLILSCFCDIACGIGDEFTKYFPQKYFSFA